MGKSDVNVMTGTKVPALRFKGFNDEWVERKLGDVLTERNVQHEPTDEYPLVSFTVENGVTPKTDRYNREFLVRTLDKKYKATEINDIVYNPANLKFGAIALNTYGKAVFSPIYVTFTVNTGIDPYYMGLFVTREDFINFSLKYQEGTVYERMSVKSGDFLSLDMSIPELPEQQAIGQFSKTIDALIQSEEDKLEQLQSLKKSFLQKMFPKKGATVPELRFDGFSGDWTEKKLGDVLVKGSRTRVDDPDDYGRLTVKLNHQGLEVFEIERKMANTRPFYQRFAGEIIIGKQNYFNGSLAIVTDEFDGYVASNAIMSFKVLDDLASTFFIYNYIGLDDFMKEREHLANGTGQKELSETDFLNFELFIPTLEEQVAIGQFFKTFDELIAKQEEKVENGKTLKKSLLQKMFV